MEYEPNFWHNPLSRFFTMSWYAKCLLLIKRGNGKSPTNGCLNRKIIYNVVKTIINHPIFDGLYHPIMVILGMVYYCFYRIRWKSFQLATFEYRRVHEKPSGSGIATANVMNVGEQDIESPFVNMAKECYFEDPLTDHNWLVTTD